MKPVVVRELLAKGSALLKEAGIETPALDASLLLADVLHLNRARLFAAMPETVNDEAQNLFSLALERRLDGDCVAYITGRKEFYGLDFMVTPDVLVPRSETEILVEAAIEIIDESSAPYPILDLCTGSGAIAVSLKHERPDIEVWASDISEAALQVAVSNAGRILSGKVSLRAKPDAAEPIHFFQGDLFIPGICTPRPIPHFSLIVSNPPYVPAALIPALAREVRKEPALALDGGADGLVLIRRIIAGSVQHLLPGGTLLLEADGGQMEAIRALLADTGFTDITIRCDLAGIERVIGARLPKVA
ncbi:release factor glutamine methyltransferase [Spirochaetia bacterium]|nr:release factor glutamine methyltransferase [Spirochaetia bacterium]